MPNYNTDNGPKPKLALITPGSTVLSTDLYAIYIATGGTINITNWDDTTEASVPVATGTTLPFRPKKITAASSAVVYGYYQA
jgi:hypothetical protein